MANQVKRSHCKLPKSTLSLVALLVSMLPEADVRAQVPGERPPANILRLAQPALDFARRILWIGENKVWRDALNKNLNASGKNGAPTPGFAILPVLEGILTQEPKP